MNSLVPRKPTTRNQSQSLLNIKLVPSLKNSIKARISELKEDKVQDRKWKQNQSMAKKIRKPGKKIQQLKQEPCLISEQVSSVMIEKRNFIIDHKIDKIIPSVKENIKSIHH